MRIAFMLRNLSIGGIQRLAIDDANELASRGHDVHMIYFEESSPSMRASLRVPDENVHYLPYRRFRNLGAFRELTRLLKRLKPEMLVTHQWFSNTVGRLAGLAAGTPKAIAFEHSVDDVRKPKIQLFIDRALQAISTRIVAVSEPVRDSLVRAGISRGRISILPNGADLKGFSPREVSGGTRFLFIGRLVKDKGVDILLDALARAEGITLTIAGDGPERAALESRARALAIADRIRFLGAVDDRAALLADADCLVLPSVREGFGLVLVEARAAGVPCIVSETAAAAGVITREENGLVVPTRDVQALADAFVRFRDDATLRATLSANAPRGIEKYGITAHADALLALMNV